MEMLKLVWNLLYLALILILVFILNFVYSFIYKPWRARLKYSKYPNVTMTEKYYPMLGEIKLLNENSAQNKPVLHHYYKDSNKKGDKIDLRLTQFGAFHRIEAISPKAIDEFEKLIPHKIDRIE